MKLVARLWSSGHASEDAQSPLGALLWDAIGRRLGVFNNEAGGVLSWYPRVNPVTNRLDLNQGQRLSGLDSSGAANAVVLDFSQAGTARFINANTNAVLATIGLTDQTFLSASSLSAGSNGNFNHIINAGLQVVSSLIAGPTSYSTQGPTLTATGKLFANDAAGYWRSPVVIAPNLYGWRKAGSYGNATFSLVTGAIGTRALSVDAVGAPSDLGARVYCLDYKALLGAPISFSERVKGPTGSQATVRIVTEQGGVVASQTVTGTGDWQTVTINAFSLLNNGSKWLAVDVLYNPGGNAPDAVTWQAEAWQITQSPIPMPFNTRPAVVEKTLLAPMFHEERLSFESSSLSPGQSKVITLGFLPGFGTPRTDYRASTGESVSFINENADNVVAIRRYTGNTTYNQGIGIPAPPSNLLAAEVRTRTFLIPSTDTDLA